MFSSLLQNIQLESGMIRIRRDTYSHLHTHTDRHNTHVSKITDTHSLHMQAWHAHTQERMPIPKLSPGVPRYPELPRPELQLSPGFIGVGVQAKDRMKGELPGSSLHLVTIFLQPKNREQNPLYPLHPNKWACFPDLSGQPHFLHQPWGKNAAHPIHERAYERDSLGNGRPQAPT